MLPKVQQLLRYAVRIANDARRNENSDFCVLLLFLDSSEESPDSRNGSQEWNLAHSIHGLALNESTDDDSPTILNIDFGGHDSTIDNRIRIATLRTARTAVTNVLTNFGPFNLNADHVSANAWSDYEIDACIHFLNILSKKQVRVGGLQTEKCFTLDGDRRLLTILCGNAWSRSNRNLALLRE